MLFIYLAMIDDDTQRSKFEYIYHTYYGMMYKVAYELTKDQRLAEDAVHETMVNIIEDQGDFVFAVEEKNTVLGTQNVLVRIPVTVLEVGQSQTSIEGAISPEDSIVVQSTRSLEAGSKVRVKNENT